MYVHRELARSDTRTRTTMETYSTMQHLDPHTVTMGVLYCLVIAVALVAAIVKAFRSF